MHPLQHWDEDGLGHPNHKHGAGQTGWGLSIMAGYLGLVVLTLLVVLLVLLGSQGMQETLSRTLPKPVSRFFNPDPKPQGPSPEQSVAERARAEVQKTLPRTLAGARIGVGSTKDEVLAIQGEPDFISATLWRYGKSEVYFKDGHVTGYHNSAGNPLKLR